MLCVTRDDDDCLPDLCRASSGSGQPCTRPCCFLVSAASSSSASICWSGARSPQEQCPLAPCLPCASSGLASLCRWSSLGPTLATRPLHQKTLCAPTKFLGRFLSRCGVRHVWCARVHNAGACGLCSVQQVCQLLLCCTHVSVGKRLDQQAGGHVMCHLPHRAGAGCLCVLQMSMTAPVAWGQVLQGLPCMWRVLL